MPSITLTATTEDYEASLPGFLHEHPIPVVNGAPIMNAGAWLKKWFEDSYFREAEEGLKRIAANAIVLNKVFK